MKKNLVMFFTCLVFSINIFAQNMIKITGSTFTMGNNEYKDSAPEHVVVLKDFLVSTDLVCRGDFEDIFGSPFTGDAYDAENYVLTDEMAKEVSTDISWFSAIVYCNKMSEKEGLDLFYNIPGKTWDPKDITINENSNGYRLLTEAEWEFISQNQNRYQEIQNLGDEYYEWVWDGFIEYSEEKKDNPVDSSGLYERVIRGGKYFERISAPSADRHMHCLETGFRLARYINNV